jgi:hypothetical protein
MSKKEPIMKNPFYAEIIHILISSSPFSKNIA